MVKNKVTVKGEFPAPGLLPEGVEACLLSGGHINGTWLLSVGGAPLNILQRINPIVFKEPLEVTGNYLKIYNHLIAQAGFELRLPAPVPFRDGRLDFCSEDGAVWRMTRFLENTFGMEHPSEPATAYEAALAVGRFLKGLDGLSPAVIFPVIPGFHDSVKRLRRFLQIELNAPESKRRAAEQEIKFLKDEGRLFDEIAALDLPLRVVHNDAKLANVLFDQTTRRACAVIDWDTVMPGSALADFGDLVRSLAAEAPEDAADPGSIAIKPDFFKALCEGFLEGAGDILTSKEKEQLLMGAFWLVLEQALRFLTDYLEGDVYYPVQYPEHNLIRTRSQLALYRQLREQEPALRRIIAECLQN